MNRFSKYVAGRLNSLEDEPDNAVRYGIVLDILDSLTRRIEVGSLSQKEIEDIAEQIQDHLNALKAV